jgi:hypothetical protein
MPDMSSRSYGVSTWRTEATTARVTASVEGPSGGAAADATTAPGASVPGDLFGSLGRATGEQFGDGQSEGDLQLDVLFRAALLLPQSTAMAGVLVGQALLLGLLQRLLFNQDALALVAAP